ncbi:MAG: tat (twin-arginine translocation) pathway signal sequence [Bacteroidetes bacterium GWF2_41_61]|nr:MAG: tat (twin-arginine translocation) pathway signal sequence [Bacteroidetes bacterium GWE2_40_15]OFY36784.1 MAG: tat (twin-arginine translocation) pathway signal sequence [Bacteroidetes bacterium GWF2_41_61]HBG23863.1 tat (twin-arginine translocation) pathway signal sequence [Rikenellaceae bacterium]HBZ26036.1 tat (twin-arginine translocation) pathway signal sequence [Rikenellaceae bacterium]
MERRNFIKTAILGGIAGAVQLKSNNLLAGEKMSVSASNDLVAVMGGEPGEMYKKGIAAMGGISKFVKKGQKVVVKPNIGWDKRPEFAANTNPELIAEIVKDCLAAGAAEVTVFDHTCDEWQSCYKNSGIEAAAKAAGAKLAFAHDEKYYKSVPLPMGVRLKEVKIHESIIDCDVWINVPVLKNHGGARMTIAMKNYMGIVWDRRFWHSNDLQQCIADCATYSKMPVLNIVDAYRIMTQNGPKGKSIEDVQNPKALFISADIVAVDTAAVRFFNQFREMKLEEVSHIGIAEKMKLGTTDIDNLKVERIKIG